MNRAALLVAIRRPPIDRRRARLLAPSLRRELDTDFTPTLEIILATEKDPDELALADALLRCEALLTADEDFGRRLLARAKRLAPSTPAPAPAPPPSAPQIRRPRPRRTRRHPSQRSNNDSEGASPPPLPLGRFVHPPVITRETVAELPSLVRFVRDTRRTRVTFAPSRHVQRIETRTYSIVNRYGEPVALDECDLPRLRDALTLEISGDRRTATALDLCHPIRFGT